MSHSLKNNTPRNPRPTLGNPTAVGLIDGTKSTSGDVTLEMMYQGCESLLAYCLGIPVITAAAPVYTWSFKPRTALWAGKGMSLRANYDDVANDYAGNKVASLTFSLAKDQNLQVTASIGGKSWAAQATPGTPTFPTDRPLMGPHFGWYVDDHAMAGSAETNIQSFTLTVSNALSFDRASLGSGYILEPQRNDLVSISGSITCDMLDNTYQVLQNTGADHAFDFDFTSTEVIGGGATPFQMHFWLPSIIIIGETPSVGGAGVVPQTINFQATYDATATHALEITLVNGKSAGAGDGT